MPIPIPKGDGFPTTHECRVSESFTQNTPAVPDVAFHGLRVLMCLTIVL
jgi:hypothetical protein